MGGNEQNIAIVIDAVNKASSKLDAVGESLAQMGNQAKTMAGGFLDAGRIADYALGGLLAGGLTGIATGALDFIKNAVTETEKYVGTISSAAADVGVGVEFMSRFAQAADDASIAVRGVGVDVETVSAALQRLTVRGGKGAIASALKIDVEGKSPEETIYAVADAFQKIQDPQEKAAAGSRLFGNAWKDILPILEGGREGVKQLTGAVSANLVVTDEAAQKARDYAQQMDTVQDAAKGLEMEIGGKLLPVQISLYKSLIGLAGAGDLQGRAWGEFRENGKASEGALIAISSASRETKEQLRALLLGTVYMTDADANFAAQLIKLIDHSNGVTNSFREYGEWGGAAAGAVANVSNSFQEFGEWGIKVSEISDGAALAVERERKAHEAAALAVEQHAKAIQNFVSGFSQGLPQPGKGNQKGLFEQILGLDPSDKDYANQLGALLQQMSSTLGGQLGGAAFDAGGDPTKILALSNAFKEQKISLEQFAGALTVVAPKIKGQIPQIIGDYQKMTALIGGGDSNFNIKTSTVKVQLTTSEANRVAILEGEKAKLQEAANKLDWSFTIPANRAQMGGDWAGAAGDARYNAEKAKIAEQLTKVTNELDPLLAKQQGKVFATLFSLDPAQLPTPEAVDAMLQQLLNPGALSSKTMDALEKLHPEASGADEVGKRFSTKVAEGFDAGSDAMKQAFDTTLKLVMDSGASVEAMRMWSGLGQSFMDNLASGIRNNPDVVRKALQETAASQANWLRDWLFDQIWRMMRS